MIGENNTKIAIIGLGYVGLPLAVEFGKYFNTIGFDISESRIQELLAGHDSTLEVETHELQEAKKLIYTKDTKDIQNCNIFIVAVPTPIDENNKPYLNLLIKASISVGKALKKDDIIIYESTVFPGATEEICVPVLEQNSGLKFSELQSYIRKYRVPRYAFCFSSSPIHALGCPWQTGSRNALR